MWILQLFVLSSIYPGCACVQAKLQARRDRRTMEAQRKLEEDEAQRVIADQRRQMAQEVSKDSTPDVALDTGLVVQPKVHLKESMEEKALKKEQVSWITSYGHTEDTMKLVMDICRKLWLSCLIWFFISWVLFYCFIYIYIHVRYFT